MSSACIVGLGEVLWDVYPDGEQFGGAPANFCCAAAQLAQSSAIVYMVSAVGKDDLGQLARQEMASKGVLVDAIQENDWPTGRVLVTLNKDGAASYQFDADSSWDHLLFDEKSFRLAAQADVICFGTLGQRSIQARTSILQFLSTAKRGALKILDLNLRAAFWSDEIILHSLQQANVLKLNEDELQVLADLLSLPGNSREQLEKLIRLFDLRLAAYTRGPRGSILVASSGEWSEHPGARVQFAHEESIVDTVGAGDAFTATLALGLLAQRPLNAINEQANRVAAYVCGQSGGAPILPPNLLAGNN